MPSSARSLFRWLSGLCWLLVLLATESISQAAPAKVVRVAAFPFMPGIFVDGGGKAQGFFVDMLQEVAQRENWELRFVPGTWAEGLERVRAGDVDLLTSVAYTQERDAFLDFGKVPAFTVWSILYASPGSHIQSVLDVDGHRVGVMRNDMNGAHFRQLCENFKVSCTFVEYGSFSEVLTAVAQGKVDAGVTVSTFGYAKENEYNVVRTPVVFNPFDIFFATADGKNAELLTALDAYLKAGRVDATSSYQRAIDRWLHGSQSRGLPPWVGKVGWSLLALLLISWGVVIVFRKRVAQATEEIRTLNAGLQDELAERKRKEELILNVASGVSAATGDSFFQDLVKYLGRATQSDIALVGELDTREEGAQVRTLAVFAEGAAAENLCYPLTGSPCEQVLKGELRVYPDRVQELFPKDGLLKELGAISYVGAPLASSQDFTLGHLAVISRGPLQHPEEVCSLLQIFSARAASELERRRNEA